MRLFSSKNIVTKVIHTKIKQYVEYYNSKLKKFEIIDNFPTL